MIRQFLTILILTIFFSCGQKNNSSESKIETIDNSAVDTFSTPHINQQIDHDQNCSYDNQVASLGIGLIIAPPKFEIYNDSLLSDKIASIDMYEDATKINLCSKFFKFWGIKSLYTIFFIIHLPFLFISNLNTDFANLTYSFAFKSNTTHL